MSADDTRRRADALFAEHLRDVHVKTDRLMLVILLAQWLFAVIIALAISPFAWSGKVRSVHVHVQVALVLGGLLNSLPVALIVTRPGWWLTRHVVAAAQMLWSALLIHLTGGRIEAHFHVFGSLAFLAFYRDWRVLPTATLVVAADHLLRELLWPESVYGIVNPEWWRFLEHASWVAFEDVILVLGCLRGVAETRVVADREAALETMNACIEAEVIERTAQLDASREQYRALVETTSAIPWEMDAESGQLLYVGPQAERTFGCTLEECYARGLFEDHMHPDDRPRWLAALAAARATPDGFEIQHRIVAADGGVLSVRNVVSASRGPDGRTVLRGLMFDETAQRKLEGELQQAQKLESVGRLAAGIAHEINTPVQFVSDNCTFLRDGARDITRFVAGCREVQATLESGAATPGDAAARLAARAQETDIDYLLENMPLAIEQSLEGLARVATIVRSMKQFAHPSQKERSHADLNECLASTLTIARNEYKYVADLKTDFGDLPSLPCHPGDLNQAFLNIIVNAAHAIGDVVKGTESRGEIGVRTWHEADEVCVAITDTGGGIPEGIRDRIFDPFFTTKEVGKGTGQGLAIARSVVVEKHGGTINVRSDPGSGTTFTIRLPVRPAPALDAVA